MTTPNPKPASRILEVSLKPLAMTMAMAVLWEKIPSAPVVDPQTEAVSAAPAPG